MGCCSSCKRHEVREGHAVVLWRDGKATLIKGPAVVRAGCHGSVEYVRTVSASEREYLAVTYSDGHTEHIAGPKIMFLNPVEYTNIRVEPLVVVEAGEAIIAMRRPGEDQQAEPAGAAAAAAAADDDEDDEKGKKKNKKNKKDKNKDKEASSADASRLIIRGPCYHMPTPDETLHEFVWTGRDAKNPQQKVPGALRFTKLRLTPDQMYITVPEARTSDDALLVVNLLMFFEIADLQRMLDRTHDPIADMENAATSDVVAFCAGLSYEMFLEKTDALNNMETYPQLTQRAHSIGFEITKVVYRGYSASKRLQGMHDDALQARTQLRLEAETEEQAQRLSDLKLAKEHDRQRKKQEMQREEVEHNNAVLRMQHEERLLESKQTQEAKLAEEEAANAKRLEYFSKLKELGVDINAYLAANGTRPEKLIQITEGANAANVHVHTSDN